MAAPIKFQQNYQLHLKMHNCNRDNVICKRKFHQLCENQLSKSTKNKFSDDAHNPSLHIESEAVLIPVTDEIEFSILKQASNCTDLITDIVSYLYYEIE